MFAVRFEIKALAELDSLRAFDRARIIDEVEQYRRKEPLVENRRKMILRGLIPPFIWEDGYYKAIPRLNCKSVLLFTERILTQCRARVRISSLALSGRIGR